MIYTSHIIVGSAIGYSTEKSPIAFAGGLVSHHLLDSVPHLDPGAFSKNEGDVFKPASLLFIAVDLTIGTIAFYYIWKFSGFNVSVFWGALGAVLPDVVDNGPWRAIRKLPIFKQYHQLHHSLHSTVTKKNWLLGVITQVIIIVIALTLIFYTSH